MKSVLKFSFVALICLGMTLEVGAQISKKDTAPFIPEVYKAIRDLEDKNTGQDARLVALEQIPYAKVLRAEYDVAIQGGGIGSHGLGIALPAKSIVKRTWFQIGTQFVDAGAGLVSFGCGSLNLKSSSDITGITAGTVTDGFSTGSAATMTSGNATNCEVMAVVAGAAQTAGKLVLFVEFVQGL